MKDCPFCKLVEGEDSDLIVLRTPNVIVVPALKQRRLNLGQMLVLPTVHVTRIIDVEPSKVQELYAVAGRVSMNIRKVFGATGATLFQNEDAPDQELFHLHIHVVPRRTGDDFKLPDPKCEELIRQERQHQAFALRRSLSMMEGGM